LAKPDKKKKKKKDSKIRGVPEKKNDSTEVIPNGGPMNRWGKKGTTVTNTWT